MLNYFGGWRRRLGAITLVISLLLMSGWILSRHTSFSYTFRMSDQTAHDFFSQPDWIGWTMQAGPFPAFIRTGFQSFPLNDPGSSPRELDPFFAIHSRWDPKFGGYRWVASGKPNPNLIVPYVAIVPPLTVLSAFLLFSKPRAKKAGRA